MTKIDSLDITESALNLSEERKITSKKKLLFGGVCTAAVIIVYGSYICYHLIPEKGTEVVHEYGIILPENWYHERALMNISECEHTKEKVLRREVSIKYLYRLCDDMESCVVKVKSMPNDYHFFIAIGHIFEGLGWDCNVTESLSVVFLGDRNQFDEIAFHKLLQMGLESHEISPQYQILESTRRCDNKMCQM